MEVEEDQAKERSKAVDAILGSTARHKVVVAGPGTGKTFLFRKICQVTEGDILALTFINNLARDLDHELGDLAECCTFHALCKKLIYQLPVPPIDKFIYFPKIEDIVESDKAILEPEIGRLRDAFEDFLLDDPRIPFFLQRAHYYEAVGHTDGVYQVVRFLLANPEKIPVYSQVLVDEYQDFNKLEVEMIGALRQKSPTLVVGDDDQALYDFKHASPRYLRLLAQSMEFELFELPFCSRCTEVLVEATNQLVHNAQGVGLLIGRIEKPFKCFLPGKTKDNESFSKLIHVKCSVHKKNAPYVTRFIQLEIQNILQAGYRPEFERGVWDFLVVGPGYILRGLGDTLKAVFANTFFSSTGQSGVTLLDSYTELLRNAESAIGWRAVLTFFGDEILQSVVRASESMDRPIRDLVPKAVRDEVLQTLQLLRKLRGGEDIDPFEETALLELFKVDIDALCSAFGFVSEPDEPVVLGQKHTIRVTSFLGCKGLTANYVFLVGLNDGVLPRDSGTPSDYEVCKLIVGLTRARKKCYLISVRNLFGEWLDESVFMQWIEPPLFDELYVNKDYFKQPRAQ